MTLMPSLHHPWNTYLKPIYYSSPFHSFLNCPLCPFFIFLLLCITILALEVSLRSCFYFRCHSWTYCGGHTSRREILLPLRETPGSTSLCIKMLVSFADFSALTVVLTISWPRPTQSSAILGISFKTSFISLLKVAKVHLNEWVQFQLTGISGW